MFVDQEPRAAPTHLINLNKLMGKTIRGGQSSMCQCFNVFLNMSLSSAQSCLAGSVDGTWVESYY